MTEIVIYTIVAAVSLLIGGLVTSTFLRKAVERKSENILKEAKEKAEVLKKEKILQAKEKFLQLKSEHEKVINQRNSAVQVCENKIKQREGVISQKFEEIRRKQNEVNTIKTNLINQLEIIEKRQSELEKSHTKQVEQLEKISGLSADEAKAQLVETLKDEAKTGAMVQIKEIIEEGIKNGEIRDDIPVWSLRQIILGGIEHLTLPSVIFGREFSVDEMTEDLCNVIFEGIAKHD